MWSWTTRPRHPPRHPPHTDVNLTAVFYCNMATCLRHALSHGAKSGFGVELRRKCGRVWEFVWGVASGREVARALRFLSAATVWEVGSAERMWQRLSGCPRLCSNGFSLNLGQLICARQERLAALVVEPNLCSK